MPSIDTTDLVLERCPCCRARVARDADPEAPCRRCEGSLEALHGVYEAAARWRHNARRALAANQPAEAVRCAQQAVKLVDAPATRATLCAALSAAGLRDQAEALLNAPPPRR